MKSSFCCDLIILRVLQLENASNCGRAIDYGKLIMICLNAQLDVLPEEGQVIWPLPGPYFVFLCSVSAH